MYNWLGILIGFTNYCYIRSYKVANGVKAILITPMQKLYRVINVLVFQWIINYNHW